MLFSLTDEQLMIQSMVREFSRKVVAETAAERDKTKEFPADNLKRMAELGLLGLMVPFAAFDNALDALMRDNFGIGTGLLVTGSIWLLVLAYMVRFMAAALGAYDGGQATIHTNMDAVARTLGQSPGRLRAPGTVQGADGGRGDLRRARRRHRPCGPWTRRSGPSRGRTAPGPVQTDTSVPGRGSALPQPGTPEDPHLRP